MKYIVRKERFRRLNYCRLEVRRMMGVAILRSEYVDQTTREQVRGDARVRVRIRNRCIYTGRGRSVSRLYGMSRMVMLEMTRGGRIKGGRKGTW